MVSLMGLNIFSIEVHPGVYSRILKASYLIFDRLPEFSVRISHLFSIVWRASGVALRVRYTTTFKAQWFWQSYWAPPAGRRWKECHITQLKVLQIDYRWESSLRWLEGFILYFNSVSTREESGSESPAWARISRKTRLVSIGCITRSILLCVSMCLNKKARRLHCQGLLELRLEKST